jgi:hypothetical protein
LPVFFPLRNPSFALCIAPLRFRSLVSRLARSLLGILAMAFCNAMGLRFVGDLSPAFL